jgi:BCL2-associated athanogene 2
VNTLINEMVFSIQQDPQGTHGRCLSYMRACSAQGEDEVLYAMVKGLQPLHADKGFEEALLGCTLDDQKLVKRRLNGLLDYILKL